MPGFYGLVHYPSKVELPSEGTRGLRIPEGAQHL